MKINNDYSFSDIEIMKWQADEYVCVDEFLNKLNVPREDSDGNKYSTVGRICELIRMSESNMYPIRELSKNDFVNSVIANI